MSKKKDKIIYDSVRLFEFQDKSMYLYKRDNSGRPGLFLSGSVAQMDVKALIDSQGKNSEKSVVENFIQKKIMWFSKGKLIKDEILSEFPNIQDELRQMFSELASNKDKIGDEIVSQIKESKPQKYLITMMPPQNEDSEFIGKIEDYVSIFNKGALSKKNLKQSDDDM